MFVPTNMKPAPTLRIVRQMFAKQPKFKHLITADDVPFLRVTSTGAPITSQLDGDYLDLRDIMTFRAVQDTLLVVTSACQNRT